MDLPVVTAARTPAPANPHYERLGGAPVIAHLVDAFYGHMSTLPEAAGIRAMHEADLAPTKAVLVAYLAEWTGGPKNYTPWRGVPKLGRVHRPFAIGPAERDAWMHCMSLALDDVGADSALKGELLRAFAKVADHLASHHPATDHPATAPHAPATAAAGGPVTPGATR